MYSKTLALISLCALISSCGFTPNVPQEKRASPKHIHSWINKNHYAKKNECSQLYEYLGKILIISGDLENSSSAPLTVFSPQNGHILVGGVPWVLKTKHATDVCNVRVEFGKSLNTVDDTQDKARVYNLATKRRLRLLTSISRALEKVAAYEGENITSDLSAEIRQIERVFYGDTTHGASFDLGRLVDTHSYNMSFSRYISWLDRFDHLKGIELARIKREDERKQTFKDAQSSERNNLNTAARNIWNSRKLKEEILNSGAKICSYDNKMGFVEEAKDNNIKVLWKGKILGQPDGFYFGNIPYRAMSRTQLGVFNYKYEKLSEFTWTTKDEVAKCEHTL